MSEKLIQKLLDIGGCGAETEWAQGYDDGVNAAIDEVERYFKQPTLNENQQLALKVLKEEYEDRGNCAAAIYWALEDDSLPKLEKKEFAKVLQVFSQWAREQEEE